MKKVSPKIVLHSEVPNLEKLPNVPNLVTLVSILTLETDLGKKSHRLDKKINVMTL
jgi:hypothetical protein